MRNVKEKLLKNVANKVGEIAESNADVSPYWYSPFLFGHEISLEETDEELEENTEAKEKK